MDNQVVSSQSITVNLPSRFHLSFREGSLAQERFTSAARSAGYLVQPASEQVDMFDHIDLYIKSNRTYSVDVKGKKRLFRAGEVQGDFTCLELHGVHEKNRGWLYDGKAELIAFETHNSFLLVWRKRLRALVDMLVSSERVARSEDAIYKIYSRRGYEEITWVETAQLRHPWFLFGEIRQVDEV